MSERAFFLTVVFEYKDEMVRATSNFMEEDVGRELDTMGLCWPASHKEVHVSYQVELPLFQEWIERLMHLKTMKMIARWYVTQVIDGVAFITQGDDTEALASLPEEQPFS
jgi:hypothetical protein